MTKRNYIPDTSCICINLRRVSQKVTDFYDNAFRELGVSVNQYSLLVNISRIEGCCTGELAKRVKQEKSTLVRTLQPLFREGLIIDKSLDEYRKRQLYLTPQGEAVLKKAYPLWKQAQEEIAAKLGKDYDELMAIFQQMDTWD